MIEHNTEIAIILLDRFSKHGLWISSFSITWKCIKMQNLRSKPRPSPELETLDGGGCPRNARSASESVEGWCRWVCSKEAQRGRKAVTEQDRGEMSLGGPPGWSKELELTSDHRREMSLGE